MQWHYPAVLRLVGYVADHAIAWGLSALTAWVRWFWRLGSLAKLFAVAAHLIAINVVASWLGSDVLGIEPVELASLGLVFFAIASLLFGSARPRRER